MTVPTTRTDLDAVADANSPSGSDSAKGIVDNFFRAHGSFIRKNYDDITGHVADTDNPHAVTAAQIGAVTLTGTQTIAGVKTFSSSPVVPTPTTDTQSANKAYADSAALAAGATAANIATVIHAATSKTTPVDADEFPIVDSEASYEIKNLTFANLKSYVESITFGIGQSWTNVLASRASGASYQNTTIKPIALFMKCQDSAGTISISTNGTSWITTGNFSADTDDLDSVITFIIPPNVYYKIIAGSISTWWELR